MTLGAWNRLRLSITPREKPLLLKSGMWPGITINWWTLYFDRKLGMGGRLPILLFHSVRVLASLVWEGVRWLAMVRVLMRRWVLHHAGLVWMLLDIWALLIEVRGTLRICLILPYTLTRWRLLKSWLSFLVIFNISLIAFFNSIWSIYLVDFNVFISKSLTTRFGVDFKMIEVLHILRWSTVVLATRVEPTQLLLCFLLMEDIQVRAMRSLNSND